MARAPGRQMRGAATQAMPERIVMSGNEVDACPPPRPSGLWLADSICHHIYGKGHLVFATAGCCAICAHVEEATTKA